jgi:hypothetical protein
VCQPQLDRRGKQETRACATHEANAATRSPSISRTFTPTAMLAGDPEAEAQHTAARARRAVAAVRGLFMVGGTRRVSTGGGKGGGSRAAVALMGVCSARGR